jgi:anaerobic magnesium-protoporphyrin IX monomethyl ester cyclase
LIPLVRSTTRDVRIVVGGYDPSLAPEAWTHRAADVDFIVRGEGEITFLMLLRALEGSTPLSDVAGLSYGMAMYSGATCRNGERNSRPPKLPARYVAA